MKHISAATLRGWITDGQELALLDAREEGEFGASHLFWSIPCPLSQAELRARIVLLDDTGARALMSAAWLRQMGHADVYVVEGGLDAVRSGGRPIPPVPEFALPTPTVDVPGLVRLLDAGAGTVVVDLARSVDYRDGHIPGAMWGIRTRLDALAPRLAGAAHVVATSPDGRLARLAVPELRGLTQGEVLALDGGTEQWHAHGRPLVKDRTVPPDEACADCYLRPYDRNSGIEEAMHAYLSWEIDLVNEIARDGTVRFGVGEASHAA